MVNTSTFQVSFYCKDFKHCRLARSWIDVWQKSNKYNVPDVVPLKDSFPSLLTLTLWLALHPFHSLHRPECKGFQAFPGSDITHRSQIWPRCPWFMFMLHTWILRQDLFFYIKCHQSPRKAHWSFMPARQTYLGYTNTHVIRICLCPVGCFHQFIFFTHLAQQLLSVDFCSGCPSINLSNRRLQSSSLRLSRRVIHIF